MRLFTSINPRAVRHLRGADVSAAYQKECIHSWLNAGFDIVSLNSAQEAEAVSKTIPKIQIVQIDGRARIIDLINEILREEQPVAGIVNADCLFTGDVNVATRIIEASKRGMLLMERINLKPDGLAAGMSCGGFDAFFLNVDILAHVVMDANLLMGDTWWDHIFPLAYRAAGGDLFQSSPCLLHLDHPLAWDEANYVRGGLIAKAMFSGKQGLPVLEHDDRDSIGEFNRDVLAFLRAVATPVNLRGDDLPAQMIDQAVWGLHEFTKPPPWVPPLDMDELSRKAVKAYRVNQPSSRILGELLCSASIVLRKVYPKSRLADAMFKAGDDLQFPLYTRDDTSDQCH